MVKILGEEGQQQPDRETHTASMSHFIHPAVLQYDFSTRKSCELVAGERESIWDLFDSNMRNFYQRSSFGWIPSAKERELFHRFSRFILVRAADVNGTLQANDLIAFAMFRLERENRENVLYCYELQVSKCVQRQGLGKVLMERLVDIGSDRGVRKIMLTVFKANVDALRFYEALGFVTDETCPSDSDIEADYKILSKPIL